MRYFTPKDAAELLKAASEDRKNAIRECVAWLAMHCEDWQPQALAGEMARDLLRED